TTIPFGLLCLAEQLVPRSGPANALARLRLFANTVPTAPFKGGFRKSTIVWLIKRFFRRTLRRGRTEGAIVAETEDATRAELLDRWTEAVLLPETLVCAESDVSTQLLEGDVEVYVGWDKICPITSLQPHLSPLLKEMYCYQT
ncbi:hypothetical protein B296_00046100, partial [Ensete ventricosum]